MLMGGKDKQQHHQGADISGNSSSYGGSMEPICNLNLDDRRELDTLHALDDLESRHELKERSILERLHILDDLKERDGGAIC